MWGNPTQRGAVIALLILTSAASTASATDREGEPPRPPEHRIASNQAVSLDGNTHTGDEVNRPLSDSAVPASAAGSVQTGTSEPVASTAPPARSVDGKDRPVGSSGSRTVRRRGLATAVDVSLEGKATPWYRTGLGALVLVLALVGAVYWVGRRWMPSMRPTAGGVLRVVARTSLTPKHAVALIQLGRRFVLVGISGDGMRTLSEVTEVGEVGELTAQTGTAAAQGARSFERLLLRESADFGETAAGGELTDELEAGRTRSERSRLVRTPEPLSGLLQKLRKLQSK